MQYSWNLGYLRPPRVVAFWSATGLTGPLKIVLLIVLFAVCVSLVPG